MLRGLTATDKKLWQLAVPMILSNISVPLLGLVDTMVIGHLSHEVFLAGVAIGSSVTSFAFMLFLFLRMGTTGLTAQAWGEKQPNKLRQSLLQPLLLALAVGLFFALFHHPLTEWILRVMGTEQKTGDQAAIFLSIRWLSAPATLANMVILGWLLGVQYAKAPLILLIGGNTVNILLELLFVLHWHYAVSGAAWATVIAEYFSLLLGLYLVWRVARQRHLSLKLHWAELTHGLSRLFRLNRDILLRSLLLQLCLISFTIIGARLGTSIVAVNAILLMFITFTSYALDGFAYAVESVSGEAFGEKNSAALQAIWQSACQQAAIVAVIFCIIYGCFGERIVRLLTSLPSLQQEASHYLFWQAICPIIGVWCYLLDGLFVGATRGREMRNSMLVAALGFAITLLSVPVIGNHGLWLALMVFLALRGVTLGYAWIAHRRNNSWFDLTR
ncbi:MATE family efflux transporter DinF [Rosenbergiella australiborealis]|uniref:MATE family efflux transporter DinF n=1 Tax=Rosenbergiella australiborealis TaxID=1544696 RepID=A0ABS5T718_9GAMM|nr:MATE family efflux transporter DinF [Rosenbergiella australiborealis]MBT0727232.1 MATE family efflux transporter DinF [Rosenbergiella australiborealis]